MFILLADLMLHILLDTAQHEWLENGMQTLNLDLIEFLLILTMGLNVLREPLIEKFMGIEEIRHDEVQQCP